MLEIGDKYMMF